MASRDQQRRGGQSRRGGQQPHGSGQQPRRSGQQPRRSGQQYSRSGQQPRRGGQQYSRSAQQQRRRKSRRRQKILLVSAVVILILIVVGITGLTTFVRKYAPTGERTDYASYYDLGEDSVFVTYNETKAENNGILSDGEVYIHYNTVHDYLNDRFYWDGTEQILRYTVPEGLISIVPDTTEYTLGRDTMQAEHPIVLVRGEDMYLSLSFIQQYTNIRSEVFQDPNRVAISNKWDEVAYTQVKKATQIREKGGVKSPVLKDVEKGDLVTVIETVESWVKVCTQDGFIGYMKKKALGDEQKVLYDSTYEEPQFTHIEKDFKINMAWHQVTNQKANDRVSNVLDRTKGVNVISPTWFYLNDNKGGIVDLASTQYVNYCHQKGIEVWGLVSNLENKDVDTTTVLNVTSNRDNLVNNLIAQAIKYDLDGINVDFELLPEEAAGGYLQFIRELSLKCDNNELVLSVDNYVPASYNTYYDMNEQAVFADYVALMAYDEHYSGSEEGSVASLSYVEQGVADTLKMVPAKQLILGIPFYTRLWELTPTGNEDQPYNISSEALGMSDAEAAVAENNATLEWQDEAGQYYTEYEKGGKTYKIWMEDQNSIEKKLEVMQSNDLAGAAFWKLNYEKNTVWDTIIKYVGN